MVQEAHVEPGREHFDFRTYVTKGRWASYWHQIDEVLDVRPSSVLVVGAGDALVVDVLRSGGTVTTTCDIVSDLSPDIVADVCDLPLEADTFDVTTCCQVLEHIPFSSVPQALAELARVTRRRVIISVPDSSRTMSLSLGVGRGHVYHKRFELLRRRVWRYNGVHFWELGTKNYSTYEFLRLLEAVFKVEDSYTVAEYGYHRFFVLQPLEPASKH